MVKYKLEFIHPQFNIDDTTSYVLTEQIKTIDKYKLYGYMGQIDSDTMKKIDDAIKLQLALDKIDTDNEIIKALKEISGLLETIEQQKTEQVTKDVEKDKELKETIMEVKRKVTNYSGMSQIEKFNARYNINTQQCIKKPDVKNETPASHKGGRRAKWTEELKMQLLDDAETMSIDEILSKHSFNNPHTAQCYISKFKRQRRETLV